MLTFLLESAARSLALGIVVWIALLLFRVRTAQNHSVAWTAVLLSSVTMPLLMQAMAAVLASAPPAAAAWIPTAGSLRLPPLAPTVSTGVASSIDAMTVASAVYLFVAGVFLLRVLAGLLRGRRLVKAAAPLKESWSAGLDIRASKSLTIPVTYGSTILFPSGWTEWTDFKREAVLFHELSHVRRFDFHTHLLADFHRALFWFSPLSWWLQRKLQEVAEVACDDAAIRKVEDCLSYAEILVEFAGKASTSKFAGVAMASGRTVERRVERLLREAAAATPPSILRRVAFVAALVPVIAMAAGGWHVRAATAPVSQAPLQSQAPTSLLALWPEQEVPDIIAPEERDAFQKLRTDQEREQYIKEFWLRRDPTPGTVDNEYRNEYYGRIALANQRFGTPAGIPGWRTDRGRIFVMNGPPDEIETQAQGAVGARGQAGTVNTAPFERWRYRWIEGLRQQNVILEFVDTDRDGSYPLQRDATARDFLDRLALPPR